ncbi:YfbM family protein [Micrococcoides hystricis]|uniref:YfbM family protein n=1 Tax=Micrococcoides hystricis TaxID=1572761 RepID=A0ABV6P8G6_9MICC
MGMIWTANRLSEAQARELLIDPEAYFSFIEEDHSEHAIDLDKAWQGIHWLLTGSAGPTDTAESLAIYGWEAGELLEIDAGYGQPALLWPDRVQDVNAALQRLTDQELQQRFNPEQMSNSPLYPDLWDEEDIFETYLLPYAQQLRKFYAAAARNRQAVVMAIT